MSGDDEVDKLNEQFIKYCRFGNPTKTTMTTSGCTKMMKECKVITGPSGKYTSTDTDISFCKVKQKSQKEINFSEFKKLLDDMAKKKGGMTREQIEEKITAGTGPTTAGTTKTSKTGNVDHFTDVTKYTGSHKERFDDSGKGKGIDGRVYRVSDKGYVTGYKEEGSYEKKVDEK